MSEPTLQWLFGIIGAWCGGLSMAVLRIIIVQNRIQTILIMTSRKAAEILHSPDNHHGLDELLDEYISREDLTNEHWQRLHDLVNDTSVPKDERLLCLFITAFSKHKLRRGGFGNTTKKE